MARFSLSALVLALSVWNYGVAGIDLDIESEGE